MSKTSITERNKAIRLAWERERELVLEGKGTRNWIEAQQRDILDPDKGKAYDDDGRAFQGQHMKSAAEYPEYQGDPDNIQFLTRDEHLEAHKGSWKNATNWYYNPDTKEFVDFGDNRPTPCKIINLSNPIAVHTASLTAEQVEVESARERQNSSMASDKPDSIPIKNETRATSPSHSKNEKLNIHSTQRNGVRKIIDTIKTSAGKAVKWTWQHKGEIGKIIVGAVTVGGIIADAVNKSNSGKSGNGDFNRTDYSYNNHPSSGESYTSDEYLPDLSDETIDDYDDSESTGTPKKPHPRRGYPGKRWKKNKDGELELTDTWITGTFVHKDQMGNE